MTNYRRDFSDKAMACLSELGAVLRKHGVRLVTETPCVLEMRHFDERSNDGQFVNLIPVDCIEIDHQSRGLVITRVMDDGVQTKDGVA